MVELETERLILRRGRATMPTSEEIEVDYHRYCIEHEDPECTFELYRDVTLHSYFSAKEGSPFGHYVLYLKSENRWIGHCPLVARLCSPDEIARFSPSEMAIASSHHRLEVEIGWALSLYYRGQGYATEAAATLLKYAFQTLGVCRIIAFTQQDNPASINVMRRLNMSIDLQSHIPSVIGWAENN